MAHWLCIRLPQLPLELFSRNGSEALPLAVSQPGRRARVLLCNAAAHHLGVRPGLSVAAARALAHGLVVKPRDEAAEQQALEALAAWAYQFTSQVSLYPPYELLLEVQGSFTLHRGHAALLSTLRAGLDGLGYQARLAGAPTPLGALSLARCHREQHIRLPHRLVDALAELPVSVLDWPQEALDRLDGMGVHCLDALFSLPRDGLARRFGEHGLRYLDRMLGRVPHPQQHYNPPDMFERRVQLPADVDDTQALLFPLQRLLRELCGWLQGLGAALQRVDIELLHRDRSATCFALGLYQPGRDAGAFITVLRDRLERMRLDAPVSDIALRSHALFRLDGESQDMFEAGSETDRVDLLDRLRARLGGDAVTGLGSVPEHRPECAWHYGPPGDGCTGTVGRQRPLWLLSVPRPLKVIDGRPQLRGELQLRSGTERIESGWWDGREIARDYYIATTPEGSSYWIYRELAGERGWYLQGIFE